MLLYITSLFMMGRIFLVLPPLMVMFNHAGARLANRADKIVSNRNRVNKLEV